MKKKNPQELKVTEEKKNNSLFFFFVDNKSLFLLFLLSSQSHKKNNNAPKKTNRRSSCPRVKWWWIWYQYYGWTCISIHLLYCIKIVGGWERKKKGGRKNAARIRWFFDLTIYIYVLHNNSFILVLMNFKHMVLEWLISISWKVQAFVPFGSVITHYHNK